MPVTLTVPVVPIAKVVFCICAPLIAISDTYPSRVPVIVIVPSPSDMTAPGLSNILVLT